MFRLKKIHPPYGTEVTPVWEPAYSEHVKVVHGLCEVREIATRDYLLNIGYELLTEPDKAARPADHAESDRRRRDK